MSGAEALKNLRAPWIDTRRAERRVVRVESLDDLVAELDRIEPAGAPEGEGLRVTGNWSVGQILEHLAITMERSMDGFASGPESAAAMPGGIANLAAKAQRKRALDREHRLRSRLLTHAMTPGGPSVGLGEELAPPAQAWTPHGAARLRAAVRRIREGHAMERASPTAGAMTRGEWMAFHVRHAALHLSFIVLGQWR